MLVAFQQVEDALSTTRIYSQQILTQQQAVESVQESLNLEMNRYEAGVDPCVDVVIAQTALLNSQVTLNSLQVNEMLSSVQLVEALGGGWNRSQLPTPREVSAKPPSGTYVMQLRQLGSGFCP